MRDTFENTIYDLAGNDKNILILMGDTGSSLNKFKQTYPNQIFNMGVAEQNMVGVAAGISKVGFIPFVYTITPFLISRPYEFIKIDVCYNNSNVKLVSYGAGLHYSSQGPSHHGLDDISITKVLPNIKIFSPSNKMESDKLTRIAYEIYGPTYMRIGRSKEIGLEYDIKMGKGVTLKDGDDATIIATGAAVYDAYMAAKELEFRMDYEVSIRVINIHTIKPLDKDIILRAARGTGHILTVEEHYKEGGLGDSIASVLLEGGANNISFKRMGVDDIFCSYYGSYDYLKQTLGLTQSDIVRELKYLLSRK